MTKLSILICTQPQREFWFTRIMKHLFVMRDGIQEPIEIINDPHPTDLIGTKRNRLLQSAKGEYVAFIDDDDLVSLDYFKLLFEGINAGVDCCSLKGVITEDGQNPLLFEHSIKYNIWRTIADSVHGEVRYERNPNHLNCIKASIAKQFSFPDKNQGEDHDWSKQLFNSGLLKTEHYIPEVIYYYLYRSKK